MLHFLVSFQRILRFFGANRSNKKKRKQQMPKSQTKDAKKPKKPTEARKTRKNPNKKKKKHTFLTPGSWRPWIQAISIIGSKSDMENDPSVLRRYPLVFPNIAIEYPTSSSLVHGFQPAMLDYQSVSLQVAVGTFLGRLSGSLHQWWRGQVIAAFSATTNECLQV